MFKDKSKEELLAIRDEAIKRFGELEDALLAIYEEEATSNDVMLKVGSTFKNRVGEKVFIIKRDNLVYTGKNLDVKSSKITDIFVEYYICGSRSKNKQQDGDLVEVCDV